MSETTNFIDMPEDELFMNYHPLYDGDWVLENHLAVYRSNHVYDKVLETERDVDCIDETNRDNTKLYTQQSIQLAIDNIIAQKASYTERAYQAILAHFQRGLNLFPTTGESQ